MKMETKKSLSSKVKVGAIIGSCAALLAVGGALAYLTDTDEATNKFDVAENLAIDLVEPQWDEAFEDNDGDGIPDGDQDQNGIPDEVDKMVPLQAVDKDPMVENESEIDAWMIAKVAVPTADVKVFEDTDNDGVADAVNEKTGEELFDYTVNSGWTQLGEVETIDGYKVYTYGFNNVVPAKAGDTVSATDTIFDTVTLINLVEQMDVSGLQIDIDAFGIQAHGFDTVDAAWAAYQAQSAAMAS